MFTNLYHLSIVTSFFLKRFIDDKVICMYNAEARLCAEKWSVLVYSRAAEMHVWAPLHPS
jgi:hypothetical protein